MSSRRAEGSIGSDLVVRGALSGKSDLRVDGIFDGEIELEGTLFVGPDGAVDAPLVVGALEVEGEVRGDVSARESVTVRAGGRLLGDVRARRIHVDDGASLQGGIEMDFELPGNEEQP